MEYLKLIGIVIIVLGFALKFDVLATVLLAGLVTGIVAGMDIPQSSDVDLPDYLPGNRDY